STPSDSRKICQAVVTLLYPQGWQFSFQSNVLEGQLEFDNHTITGQHVTTFYVQGEAAQTSASVETKGNAKKEYRLKEVFFGDKVWSPCGGNRTTARAVNVNTQWRLTATNQTPKGKVTQTKSTLKLQWRKC